MCNGFPLLLMLLHVVTAIYGWPSSNVYCFIFTMHMVIISIGFKHGCWKIESICWKLKPKAGDQSSKNISNINDIKGYFNGTIIYNGENSSQPCLIAGGYHSSKKIPGKIMKELQLMKQHTYDAVLPRRHVQILCRLADPGFGKKIRALRALCSFLFGGRFAWNFAGFLCKMVTLGFHRNGILGFEVAQSPCLVHFASHEAPVSSRTPKMAWIHGWWSHHGMNQVNWNPSPKC